MPNLSDTVVSYIRTYVPVAVGLLVGWLQPFGIEVETTTATALLVTAVTGIYYFIARTLERQFPQFGWLLGAAKQPVYVEPIIIEEGGVIEVEGKAAK